jgi:hypothetical protein
MFFKFAESMNTVVAIISPLVKLGKDVFFCHQSAISYGLSHSAVIMRETRRTDPRDDQDRQQLVPLSARQRRVPLRRGAAKGD